MTTRAGPWWRYGALAALAYLPVLRSARGQVAADTKQYLYLDPGRLLASAPSLWDPSVHLGTVTHQNIGYLFPAGPFYWFFDRVGVPDWIAQRLWLGTILFAAACGVLFLLRTLGVAGAGATVAAVVYMLSPYTLAYSARISVLLLAWAALPWLVALAERGLRDGGWRAPAAFALVVQAAGSVNATALVLVGLGPVLWLGHAVVIGDARVRRALATAARVAVLTVLASAWWIAGLALQAGYGLNVLEYTETVKVVSAASHAGEVLRGLGNWFFYGGDRYGAWIEASLDYTRTIWLILVGYTLPVLALLGAAVIRWRHRAYFVLLVLAGVVLAVGAYPYDEPSPFGVVLKEFSEGSSFGLALRNVGRAAPLVALGAAVLLGVGAEVVGSRLAVAGRRALALAPAVAVVVLAVLNLPALGNGTFYGKNLQRPEHLPGYWEAAVAALDARSHATRILEIPGADFTSYRWGNTVEPVTPGLTDRPYVARELLAYGSPASAQLLVAFDRRLQLGTLEPEALVPLARLLGAGELVVRSDLAVDRFDLARPAEVMALLEPRPAGLGPAAGYGEDLGPPLPLPLIDERSLALRPGLVDPAPVAVFPVTGPRARLRAETGPGLLVSGDADGVVDLAAVGLLDRDVLVRYSASLRDPAARRAALTTNPVLVVTDTNRRRAQRWDSTRDTVGYTERAGERPLGRDPFDKRLEPFVGASDRARTVVRQPGAKVSATAYGAPNVYLPADRPARAFDGDLSTAWRVGAYAPVVGERIRLDLASPIRADRLNLVQPLTGEANRFVTQVRLSFGDAQGRPVGDDVIADLGPESRTPDGQTVTFAARRFTRLELTVTADNVGVQPWYPSDSPVGFAEIRLRDQRTGEEVRVDEVVRLPRDLVGARGTGDLDRALVYVMTRQRNRVALPNISEEEAALAREFRVPAAREFGLLGWARVSPSAPGEVVDELLGIPGATAGGITVRASSHLPTTAGARGSAALDGDPTTAWTPDFGEQPGEFVEVQTAAPVAFDRLDLVVVADGRHSVPTRLRVSAGGEERTVDLPALEDGADEGTVRPVTVQFAPLVGDRLRVTVDAVRELPTTTSGYVRSAPVAIAELGIPGVRRAAPAGLSPACRDDLLALDGTALPVRVVGDPAGSGDRLTLEVCPVDGRSSIGRLAPGDHVLRAAPDRLTGLDVDRIVLASDVGGAALVPDARGIERLASLAGSGGPPVRVESQGRTRWRATVREVDGPFWLVLGQSLNPGWRAEANGRDLGRPQLVDGFANGWLVDPGSAREVVVRLTWTPQRWVWTALALSLGALASCVAILWRTRRRGARPVENLPGSAPYLASPLVAPGAPASIGTAVATGGALGVLGAIVAAPWVGLVAGSLAGMVVRNGRLRSVLSLGAPLCLGVVGAYVALQQVRYRYPTVLDWPAYFDRVHALALLAVVLLFADAVVEVVRTRTSSRPGP